MANDENMVNHENMGNKRSFSTSEGTDDILSSSSSYYTNQPSSNSTNQASCNLTSRKKKRKKTEVTVLFLFYFMILYTNAGFTLYQYLNQRAQVSELNSIAAQSRTPKQRLTWSTEESRFSDRMFYRLFRMNRT